MCSNCMYMDEDMVWHQRAGEGRALRFTRGRTPRKLYMAAAQASVSESPMMRIGSLSNRPAAAQADFYCTSDNGVHKIFRSDGKSWGSATYEDLCELTEQMHAAGEWSARSAECIAEVMLRVDSRTILEDGKRRGIKGENPILFADHIKMRQRREIGNRTGVPDPEIRQGMYNRAHPQGRKINSKEARARHGSSYYKG